jgi:hypothetical protein
MKWFNFKKTYDNIELNYSKSSDSNDSLIKSIDLIECNTHDDDLNDLITYIINVNNNILLKKIFKHLKYVLLKKNICSILKKCVYHRRS